MEEQSKDLRPEQKQLTNGWANPPSLSDLKGDYQDALSHHNTHVAQVDQWLDYMNVTGDAAVAARKGRSSVTPRLIRKQAEWRYPALSEAFLSHEDLFTTEPVTFEDVKAAYQNGLILNNQWNTKIGKVAFIDDYVRACVDEGGALVRVGWVFEEEEVEVPNLVPLPVTDPQLRYAIESAIGVILQAQQDPNAAQALEQLPPDLLESAQLSMEQDRIMEMGVHPTRPTRTEMRTLRNHPTAEVCDYASTIVDPLCKGKIDDAQFVIWEFETSLGALEKEGRYKNLDRIEVDTHSLNTTQTPVHGEETGGFNYKDSARKKFKAYEYWGFWDFNNTGIPEPFVSTWVGDVMIRLEASPFPDKRLPFVLVPYLPKRKHVYGESDGSLLMENQKIVGAVTRGMIDIMGRSAAGQIGYRKDALDISNMRKFEAGKDYAFNSHVDARAAFYHHSYPEIPQSAPFMLQLQHNEAESITGIKAFSNQGISGEGLGKSATAARSAIDAAGKRELAILRRLADGIVQIGRKFMSMNAVFLSEEEVVRITNEEFVPIQRDDLSGAVDIKLKISTAEADDAKAQELAFMLQTVGNSLPPEFSLLIMGEIAKLRKMPELAKRIEEYKPEPDPMQQQIQQLEIQKLMEEIEKIKSETAENYAEAQKDMADAGKATAERDKVDLDYIEQETGTTQERQKELHGAQAQANERLELLKARLQPKNSGNSQSGETTQAKET